MKVKIYTTPTCAYCHQAKEYFKKHGVEFKELDVSVDTEAREEMVEKTGQYGIPVIEIDGSIMVGFDRGRIAELLNLK